MPSLEQIRLGVTVSDYLLFPILELVIPFLNTLGLDTFWTCLLSYFATATLVSLPVLGLRLFHGETIHWYEFVGFMLPGFVWAFAIMLSNHQLALSAVSFYLGLLGWVPFTSNWLTRQLETDSPEMMIGIMVTCLCMVPILSAAMATTGDLGPPIAIRDYVANPNTIVF